ncbi:MAG TPA: C40 family peptidase [Gaiellaceae bacterium]|nr:C40 family peptidase [Gaiellaceae bacterium]
MPTALRSLLPAFALVALVTGCGGSVTASQTVVPEAVIDEAELHRPALRLIEPPPTLGERAATIALKAVGVPYRWGGASPASGFDCSGLVYWTYKRLGMELPHSSYALYDLGRRVPQARARPGDLLFFWGLGHVGIYAGHGRMVHAPHSGRSVEVVKLRGSYYDRGLIAVRRVPRA